MSKQTHIAPYFYDQTHDENFSMVTIDIFKCEQFQKLTHAARNFYLLCAVHINTLEQKTQLYKAIEYYNEKFDLGMNDQDIKEAVWGNKRMHKFSNLFCLSSSYLEEYGYSPQYANKLKKELIDNGFIEVHLFGKCKQTSWKKNATVYRFSNKWKTKNENHS